MSGVCKVINMSTTYLGLPAVPNEILDPGRGKLLSTNSLKPNSEKSDEQRISRRKAYEMETGGSSRNAVLPGGGVLARAFFGEGRGDSTMMLQKRWASGGENILYNNLHVAVIIGDGNSSLAPFWERR